MPTVEDSGTQTATLTTEHTLTTQNDSKTFQALVDCSNLQDDEYVTVRVKTKILSGGTTRVVQKLTYNAFDAAINPILMAAPVMSDQEYVVTLEQNNGTGRSFPWKVLSP